MPFTSQSVTHLGLSGDQTQGLPCHCSMLPWDWSDGSDSHRLCNYDDDDDDDDDLSKSTAVTIELWLLFPTRHSLMKLKPTFSHPI